MSAPIPSLNAAAVSALGLPFALEAHPAVPLVPVDELVAAGASVQDLVPLLVARHEEVARTMPKTALNPVGNPLRHGWEPRMWQRVRKVVADMRAESPHGVIEILLMGGWRSGKTEYCAKTLMQLLVEKPGSRAWFLQETEEASKQRQQSRLWDYFPNELKNVDTGRVKRRMDTKIAYKQGDGFTANQFVLPNVGPKGTGSEAKGIFFKMDTSAMQGEELDMAWADELVPLDKVQTLRGRLFQRDGLLLVSFTPIKGYTETVAEWLKGVEFVNGVPMGYPADKGPDGKTRYEGVEEWAEAPLLPVKDEHGNVTACERVPVVLRCRDRLRAVVWFHNAENFYGNYAALEKMLEGKPREQILIQAYGIPTKRFGSVFCFYDTNVAGPAAREDLLKRAAEFTWYHVLDPAGTGAARNPFMQWWAVARNGQKICVREWPQPGDYIPGVGDENGEWAVAGAKADGERGPAVEWFGFGFERMSAEIARVEKDLAAQCEQLRGGRVPVHERYMDSRAGHSTTMTHTGAVTLIGQWEDLPAEHRLYFLPASGDGGDAWKAIVQSKLETSERIGAPELMVCSCCQNTLFGMRNWTGEDGQSGACKDPVDCVHYIVSLDPPHVARTAGNNTSTGTVQPGGWTGYGAR